MMKRNYRGFTISQPGKFQRNKPEGNRLTSLIVRPQGVNDDGTPLKVLRYKRNDLKELEKALKKAENFIDDHLLEGKTVEIYNGKRAGERATIEAVARKIKKGKMFRFLVVAFNVRREDLPTFDTFKEEDIKIIN